MCFWMIKRSTCKLFQSYFNIYNLSNNSFKRTFNHHFRIKSKTPSNLTFFSKYYNSSPHLFIQSIRMNTQDNQDIKKTQVVKVNPKDIQESDLELAVSLIRKGEVVAFPTETVYGLGANALDANAIKKIFIAKNRPNDNPLIVHVSSLDMLSRLVSHISPQAQKLIDNFWPGPLTILFPKKNIIPDEVTCGLDTVAIRMPSHPIAHSLISLSNCPIAAPSANLSGKPSPTLADHVLNDMDKKIHLIIDGGSCDVGVESTVIDINSNPPLILRPGGITLEMIKKVIPNVKYYSKHEDVNINEEKPPTPGLKYKHYSPNASVILFENKSQSLKKLLDEINRLQNEKLVKIGLITTKSKIDSDTEKDNNLVIMQLSEDPKFVAHHLFDCLRKMDDKKVDIIFMEIVDEKDEGMAVMNRVKKAASSIIIV